MYTDKARSKEHKALRNVANKQLETTKAEGGYHGGYGASRRGDLTGAAGVRWCLFVIPPAPLSPGYILRKRGANSTKRTVLRNM